MVDMSFMFDGATASMREMFRNAIFFRLFVVSGIGPGRNFKPNTYSPYKAGGLVSDGLQPSFVSSS